MCCKVVLYTFCIKLSERSSPIASFVYENTLTFTKLFRRFKSKNLYSIFYLASTKNILTLKMCQTLDTSER